MAELLTPDICVIGAGSAGLAVAAAARAYGASVVVVERHPMGGTSLNAASLPAAALIASARHAHAMRTAGPFGIANDEPKFNYRGIHDHVRRVIEGIASNFSFERYEAMGIRLLAAEARFTDARTLRAGEVLVRARRFVIATGSRPAIPAIPGLDGVAYFTNATIFDNPRKLSHLVIIGAGQVGIELAQAYRRLGSSVTMIEIASPLAQFDPELADIALRRIEEEGVVIRRGTAVTSVQSRSFGIGVTVTRGDLAEVLDASHILVATGRVANLDELDLQKARIGRARTGAMGLVLRSGLKTTNRRVYGIGDAAGGTHHIHAASYQAGLVVRNALFGRPLRNNPNVVPRAVFTDPEIAEIGLTEPMLRQRRGNFRVQRVAFAENDRARVELDNYGLAKLVTDPKGRILGAGIVGAGAGELVALFSFAIANRLSVRHLRAFVAPYPTLAEIARRLGEEFYRDEADNRWLARLRAFNRLLP